LNKKKKVREGEISDCTPKELFKIVSSKEIDEALRMEKGKTLSFALMLRIKA
jgi:hypothetical protein